MLKSNSKGLRGTRWNTVLNLYYTLTCFMVNRGAVTAIWECIRVWGRSFRDGNDYVLGCKEVSGRGGKTLKERQRAEFTPTGLGASRRRTKSHRKFSQIIKWCGLFGLFGHLSLLWKEYLFIPMYPSSSDEIYSRSLGSVWPCNWQKDFTLRAVVPKAWCLDLEASASPGNLVKVQVLWSRLRPPRSEIVGMGPSNTVSQDLQVFLMAVQVWEPLPQIIPVSPPCTTRVSLMVAFEKLGESRIKAPGEGGRGCKSWREMATAQKPLVTQNIMDWKNRREKGKL